MGAYIGIRSYVFGQKTVIELTLLGQGIPGDVGTTRYTLYTRRTTRIYCQTALSSTKVMKRRRRAPGIMCTGGPYPPRLPHWTMWVYPNPCGDIGRWSTPFVVPNGGVVDTWWGSLHCLVFPLQCWPNPTRCQQTLSSRFTYRCVESSDAFTTMSSGGGDPGHLCTRRSYELLRELLDVGLGTRSCQLACGSEQPSVVAIQIGVHPAALSTNRCTVALSRANGSHWWGFSTAGCTQPLHRFAF